MKQTLYRIAGWMKTRLVHTPERDKGSVVWFLLMCLLATTVAAVIVAIGNPSGASMLSHAANIGKAVALNAVLLLTVTPVLGVLLSFMYVPVPRLCLGGLLYTMAVSVGILLCENSGTLFSYIAGIGYSLIVVLLGFLSIILLHKKVGRLIMFALVVSMVVIGSANLIVDQLEDSPSTLPVAADSPDPVSEANPGDSGSYDYTFLTYGSGEDVHREGFGEKVDVVTPTVDASEFITDWGDKRKAFWKFDPSDFPVNGRVWLPKGPGPFPVILMVHGNHTMEYFSTGGYDYLGEQLASRGFLTISVDEDFVNYSNVSGSPNDNYQLRAWLLLQHLQELQTMNQAQTNALYQKMDFDQVALAGHSRGGQAALMAADYKTFFDDEQLLADMEPITIKAVAALAPTDKTIDGEKPNLHNVSYLVLQGARDADISDFRGDRQFYRTTFGGYDEGFKASLYIAEANHAQFNTSWGKMDLSLPEGLFLNQRETMSPESQRQIAKVYLSAFFESVFHGESSYKELFQDQRAGREWLPDTTLVGKYRPGTYQPLVQFHRSKMETLDVTGFDNWEVTTPLDRRDKDHSRDALLLEWDNHAKYEVELPSKMLETSSRQPAEHIALTMANADSRGRVPHIEVELETADGTAVQMPLGAFKPLTPVIATDYTHFGLFDNILREGKYQKSWEPIFQTIDMPLTEFTDKDPELKANDITKLKLHFTEHPGRIYLEEIGVW